MVGFPPHCAWYCPCVCIYVWEARHFSSVTEQFCSATRPRGREGGCDDGTTLHRPILSLHMTLHTHLYMFACVMFLGCMGEGVILSGLGRVLLSIIFCLSIHQEVSSSICTYAVKVQCSQWLRILRSALELGFPILDESR